MLGQRKRASPRYAGIETTEQWYRQMVCRRPTRRHSNVRRLPACRAVCVGGFGWNLTFDYSARGATRGRSICFGLLYRVIPRFRMVGSRVNDCFASCELQHLRWLQWPRLGYISIRASKV